MGLEIGTVAANVAYFRKNDPEGADWTLEAIGTINEVLKENGLPTHSEPENLPKNVPPSRAACIGFPYSFLHHLRRTYAKCMQQSDWLPSPCDPNQDPAQDPAIHEEMAMLDSHLLCHSDCAGYYVPIQFNCSEVIFDQRLPGEMLGSSQKLLQELVFVGEKMGIDLADGKLSDAEAERCNQIGESDDGLYIEFIVWMALYETARISIEQSTAICFS